VTLMAAPTIEHQFVAGAQAWDPGSLSSELSAYFAGRDPKRTFSAIGLVD
jgi:3-oxoacyl-[acyl-carrier protein] reductase